jgi:spore coat protein U-like protein
MFINPQLAPLSKRLTTVYRVSPPARPNVVDSQTGVLRMKMTREIQTASLAAVALASLGVIADAGAGTTTGNLSVTATVTNNCSIDSTTALAFGSYDPAITNRPAGADLQSSAGVIALTCTSGATTAITIDQGLTALAGSTDILPVRQMSDGATHLLGYSIYQTGAFSTVWGNTSGTAVAYSGTGASTNVSVYGVVPKGQNVPAGSYSDTVIVTVTF